ncbi:MAG TPA: YetF domain-containing protein [Candidatus Tectomicrobia bacterium]|nr:YetF domain-containing protein [Candidatus Tectomicrobia bacterium]
MESVIRAAVIYGVLLVLFRLMGKRSLGHITTFDLILLLIISEAVQNGMVGDSYSVTNAIVLVVTLLLIDLGLSLVKRHLPRVEKWVEGVPLVIVEHGRPLEERMTKARVDVGDVLTAARMLHGLERLDQVKYAVLERNGEISIIPREPRALADHERHAAA